MQKCDPRAVARCPDSKTCGDHVFEDGSYCDKFNQQICNQPSSAEGKCGDCIHFRPVPAMRSDTKGICNAGYGERRTYMHCKYRFKAKAFTHADRIRSMSDEELAKFMQKPFCDKRTDEECKISYCGVCDQCILDWLRQPAEGKEKPEHPLRQP